MQADAGKSLHQWMKEHSLNADALKQLCNNAEACGWQRPSVRPLTHLSLYFNAYLAGLRMPS